MVAHMRYHSRRAWVRSRVVAPRGGEWGLRDPPWGRPTHQPRARSKGKGGNLLSFFNKTRIGSPPAARATPVRGSAGHPAASIYIIPSNAFCLPRTRTLLSILRIRLFISSSPPRAAVGHSGGWGRVKRPTGGRPTHQPRARSKGEGGNLWSFLTKQE